MHEDLQDFYRRGLAELDTHCRKTYNAPFVRLDAARQDEVIMALEEGKATEFTWPTAQAFFNTVRTHTMEGMFADPIYGGKRTSPAGAWWASPARNRCSRPRICRAKRHLQAAL